jgi:hypothetical protein
MPLKHILKNKAMLQKNFNFNEISMDSWPYWMFEENIKIVNEIIEEEDRNSKNEEEGMSMPNTGDIMKNASSMTSNLGNFNFPKL